MSAELHSHPANSEELRERLERLKDGGGGPTDGEMEARLRQLEADVAYIKGKVDDVPTKAWMLETMREHSISEWAVARIVFFVVGALMAAAIWGPRIVKMIESAPA